MTPAALLADLRRRGLTLTAADGRLRVTPASGLTRADHRLLGAHFRGVVRLITGDPAAGASSAPPVWVVLRSTDPAAVGGRWVGDRWLPPGPGTAPPPASAPRTGPAGAGRTGVDSRPAKCDNDHNGG